MVIGKEPNIFKLVVLEIPETYLNDVVSETNQIQNIKIDNVILLTVLNNFFYLSSLMCT